MKINKFIKMLILISFMLIYLLTLLIFIQTKDTYYGILTVLFAINFFIVFIVELLVLK